MSNNEEKEDINTQTEFTPFNISTADFLRNKNN
jgi:hypothetical protein